MSAIQGSQTNSTLALTVLTRCYGNRAPVSICCRALKLALTLNAVKADYHMPRISQCAGNEDIITMKAEDAGDTVSFMFESPKQDRIADFEMKLMDIDAEQLGIPDTDYAAR